MKFTQKLMLALAAFVLVGCATEVAQNQTNSSPAATSAETATLSNQKEPVAQSTTESTPSAGETVVSSGTFVSGEHETSGNVRIVTRDGKSFLELDDQFKTFDMGPDLVVILHKADDILATTKPPAYSLNEGDYVVLEKLQKFNGAQSYAIPESVNLTEYKSAGIWCRKFNATFGAAKLSS